MTTATARYGFAKINVLSDNVDVVADFNNNWDGIDQRLGTQVCTSSTRPSSPVQGLEIYETDTGFTRTYKGAAWSQGSTVATSGTRPVNPVQGDLLYETDTLRVLLWSGSSWVNKAFANFVCTSGTHPASPFQGLEIYETDTGLNAVYSGSGYLYGLQQIVPTQNLSAAASVTFSGLPAVNRLLLVWRLRSSTAGASLSVQLDGDTTSGHYIWAKMTQRAAAVTAAASAADTSAQIGTVAGNGTANYYSSGETYFNGWNSTNGFCNLDSSSSCWDTTSSYWIDKMGALYTGAAAAHTSVKVVPGAGTVTGEVTIYGGP